MKMGPFNYYPLIFMKSPAYIAHYYFQSEEEHFRRKSRVLDDGATNKHSGHTDIHIIHNNYLNEQLKHKYSNRIREFLNEHGIKYD